MAEYFDGRWEQKTALRKALVSLNARGESDQRIADLLAKYVGDDRVPKYGSASTRVVARATIQRVRSADDTALRGIRSATVGVLYNFLCHCDELETDLFDKSARIHSAHELAPLTSAIETHIGATDGPLTHLKLKSLQGVYSGGSDHVQMPAFESFRSPEAYYATLAHELTHWTKHKTRLDREFGRKKWGDEGYAKEELVAELGAAFLCADLALTPEAGEDHAAYIQSWLKVLKDDKRAIFAAAAHAQRAADYLHGLQADSEAKEAVAA